METIDNKEDFNGRAVTKPVSLPGDMLDRALIRAKEQTRTFSNYVQDLIRKDLRAGRRSSK